MPKTDAQRAWEQARNDAGLCAYCASSGECPRCKQSRPHDRIPYRTRCQCCTDSARERQVAAARRKGIGPRWPVPGNP